MKKLYIYLLGLLFIFSMHSCMDVDDKFENLDEISAPPNDEKETYTLTSEDYGSIADFALDADANDSLNADTIADYEFFTNTVSAAKYIPALLAEKYPAFGFQSSAMITYNFNSDNNYPLYLERFDKAKIYEVDSADYAFVSEESVKNLAFTTDFPADENLPIVLARAFAGKSNIDYVYADYNFKGGLVVHFEDNFPSDLSQYTIIDKSGSQSWQHDSYNNNGYAKITGYENSQDNANEDWLITPEIDLSDANENVSLEVVQVINYLDEALSDKVSILISTDFNGSDESAATWIDLSAQISWPEGNNWDWVNSGQVSLADYIGESVFIAFKYTSNDTDAPTWEINNILISSGSSVGAKVVQTGDYFENNNGAYSKVEGVYTLTSSDYKSLGAPGKYNNFSDDEPADAYLPDFLAGLFTTPYVGQVEKIAYTEYSGGTKYRVDEYEYIGAGTWQKYSPVVEREDQFIVDNTGHWVFDPTILNIMSKDDYQLIVDFVKETYGETYINSYGTGEIYHCADAYYGNFDLREGKFDASVFPTWQDAVEKALGVAFLPTKYPDAQLQVDGIDQVFIIEFDTYGEGSNTYKWKFQVVETGPAKFELVKEEE
jgi:hypothetical protein